MQDHRATEQESDDGLGPPRSEEECNEYEALGVNAVCRRVGLCWLQLLPSTSSNQGEASTVLLLVFDQSDTSSTARVVHSSSVKIPDIRVPV
jgi:hypothetical protein